MIFQIASWKRAAQEGNKTKAINLLKEKHNYDSFTAENIVDAYMSKPKVAQKICENSTKISIQEIKIKAYEEGFAKAETIMQEAIDKVRHAATERENAIATQHVNEIAKLKREFEKTLGNKMAEQNDRMEHLKDQIRKDRKAWDQFKDYIPEALRVVHLLKADAYNRVEEAGSRFNRLGIYENSLESLTRSIEKIAPKMQKLMEGDLVIEEIMGDGDQSDYKTLITGGKQ